MKTQYNEQEYKNKFIHLDIQLINNSQLKLNDSLKGTIIFSLINLGVMYFLKLDIIFYIIAFVLFSLLFLYQFKLTRVYGHTKSFSKLNNLNFYLTVILFILTTYLAAVLNSMILINFFHLNNGAFVSLIALTFVISIIEMTISVLYNKKFICHDLSKFNKASALLIGVAIYFIFKILQTHEYVISLIIFACLHMINFGLSRSIIRCKRLDSFYEETNQ